MIPSKSPELVLNDFYLWSGIYRKEFMKNIRLNESAGAAYQDIGFMLQAHFKALTSGITSFQNSPERAII